MAQQDLNDSPAAGCGSGDKGVVFDLVERRVHGVHLVLGELGLKWGEVEEPVPEATDDPGGHKVPAKDEEHPVSRELTTRTEGGVHLETFEEN